MAESFFQAALRATLLLVIVVCLQTGCSGKIGMPPSGGKTHTDTGKDFAENWSQFYERAISSTEGKNYREAINNLQQAVQGNDFDQWQVETPDNTVIDYFPHREMGIIYYQRQEFDKAIEELEYSIESTASAKAFFYLDQSRAGEIIKDGLDHGPPLLVLQTSTTREITAGFTKQVKGVAKDDTYIASILVNGRQVPMEYAQKSRVFTTEIPLREGENTILVLATDLAGKTSEENMIIYGDRQGPLVEIIETSRNKGDFTVKGNVFDAGGLFSLRINGRKWPITGAFEGYNFVFTQPLGTISITAKDKAGNITEAILSEDNPAADSDADSHQDDTAPTTPIAIDTHENPDLISSLIAANHPEQVEQVPPQIQVDGVINESETYNDSMVFKVSVSDTEGLHSIFINTEPVPLRRAKRVFFSVTKKLTAGRNEFHFIAFDLQGNKTDKKIVVTRKVANIQQAASRMSIAMLPFAQQGNSELLRQNISNQLADYLTAQARFQIIDHMMDDALIAEMKNPDTRQAYLNRALSAYADLGVVGVLTGTIHLSSGYGEIVGRLIDTGTGKVIASNDVFGKVTTPEELEGLLGELTDKFTRDFPVRQGIITDINSKEATINLGEKDGIKPHSRFIIYRESPPIIHPVTGSLIESDPEILGSLQVTTLHEHSAGAQIINNAQRIRQYDKVIAR